MKESKKPLSPKDVGEKGGRNQGGSAAVPGINTPGIELPAFNPPVPNRAWTAMRMGKDITELTDEEKREMYYGKDIQI